MTTNLLHKLIVAPLPYVPKSIVWRLSQRYVAGTDLEAACRTVRAANSIGCSATVDVLGEDSTTRDEVDTARDLYFAALGAIEDEGLDCNVSVKLSDLGLRYDRDLTFTVIDSIVSRAVQHSNFVRIDMEDSSVTGTTLDIYRRLREQHDNVGTVVQSCLRRTEADVQSMLDDGIAHLRLCKGIYIEPVEIAWTGADDIRESYQRLLEQLLEGGATKIGIATHDPLLVEHALDVIKRLGVDRSRYEFQMLLGVAGTLRGKLIAAGHPLRIYVPFGERWYAYSMRRLRENPEIAGHIIKNLFTRS